jgi:hypothetical protein
MSLNDHLIVIVRVPQGDPLGAAMSRIRTWLDSQKIQIAVFATAQEAGGHAFKIGFRTSEDAERFRAHFGT